MTLSRRPCRSRVSLVPGRVMRLSLLAGGDFGLTMERRAPPSQLHGLADGDHLVGLIR